MSILIFDGARDLAAFEQLSKCPENLFSERKNCQYGPPWITDGQNLTLHFGFRDHISNFRAETQPKSRL